MKLLHINSYYSCSSFYKNLYDKQINNGIDPKVFVSVPYSYKKSMDLGTYTTLSANHRKHDRFLFHLKHNKIYKDILRKYKIKDFNIVHAHSLFSNGYIALKLKQEYGLPYIVAVRNTDLNLFFKYIIYLRSLGVKILKEASKVIFLSKSYRDSIIDKYVPLSYKEEIFNKTAIIPNGIDDYWFENKGTAKNIPQKKKLKLLYVGVINKNKNILTTVKSIKKLQRKDYDVKYTIVGKVIDISIFNQVKDLSFVNYMSPKSKEELLEIYRNNDLFVMPSKTETFGLVYAEAMSQGLPIIYTRGQGFDKQFDEGEIGFSVNCFDDKELVKKILQIIKNYNLISERTIKRADKFNWSFLVKEYKNIYNSLL